MNPFRKLIRFIKEQLLSPASIRKAVVIVEKIKRAVDSKVVLHVTELTKTEKDNKAREKLSRILNEVLLALELTHHYNLSGIALRQAIEILRPMDKADRAVKYKELAGLILAKTENIDADMAVDKTQEYYNGEFVFEREKLV